MFFGFSKKNKLINKNKNDQSTRVKLTRYRSLKNIGMIASRFIMQVVRVMPWYQSASWCDRKFFFYTVFTNTRRAPHIINIEFCHCHWLSPPFDIPHHLLCLRGISFSSSFLLSSSCVLPCYFSILRCSIYIMAI